MPFSPSAKAQLSKLPPISQLIKNSGLCIRQPGEQSPDEFRQAIKLAKQPQRAHSDMDEEEGQPMRLTKKNLIKFDNM